MSFILNSLQSFAARQYQTATRLTSTAALVAEVAWENRMHIANITAVALQSSVKALRDNYNHPTNIPAHTAINTLHGIVSDPERRQIITTCAAAKMDIEQFVPEEIVRQNKKDTKFRKVFSNFTSKQRTEIASATTAKTKALGFAKLFLSPIFAIGKCGINRTYNHYLQKFVPQQINALHKKVISVEFMKSFTVNLIDHLTRLNNFEFIEKEHEDLRDELIQKIKTVILLLDQSATKIDKYVYKLAIDLSQETIETLLHDTASKVIQHALENNDNELFIRFFAYLGIDVNNSNELDTITMEKFNTLFSTIMLDAFKEALDSENIEEQLFTDAIAKLPTNLHPVIINAADNSIIKITDKVFRQVDILPFFIRSPLKFLTLEGARMWLRENRSSDVFIRQKDLASKYTVELIEKSQAHYTDPSEKRRDLEWFNSHQAKLNDIYSKIFGSEQPSSSVSIEVIED